MLHPPCSSHTRRSGRARDRLSLLSHQLPSIGTWFRESTPIGWRFPPSNAASTFSWLRSRSTGSHLMTLRTSTRKIGHAYAAGSHPHSLRATEAPNSKSFKPDERTKWAKVPKLESSAKGTCRTSICQTGSPSASLSTVTRRCMPCRENSV